LIANGSHGTKHAFSAVSKVFKGSKFHKHDYIEVLSLIYQLSKLIKTKGAVAAEAHIEQPKDSSIFTQYPKILKDEFALSLICDNLRMITLGANNPHEIENVLEVEIDKYKEEQEHSAHALQTLADGTPALGIVAAVLGVIKTMSHITSPPAELGNMIGSALVGTFFGVLLSYGFVGPMAARLKAVFDEEIKYYHAIKVALVAHLQGHPPAISVETARKAIPSECMPKFAELEEAIQEIKS
jgi:chemotaxis protein MotA